MPYAHEHNGITLKSISKDRRIKLSDIDKQNIIKLYETGLYSITGLSKTYNVNKRVIQFLLFPERLQRNKELREIRGGSKNIMIQIKTQNR